MVTNTANNDVTLDIRRISAIKHLVLISVVEDGVQEAIVLLRPEHARQVAALLLDAAKED